MSQSAKYFPILQLLIGIPIFLIVDSPYFEKHFTYAQELATLLVILVFIRSYFRRNARVRRVMILGIFIGFLGEFIFSLQLGMYHYRLENIPLWVGFGHSLIFTSVYKIIRLPYFMKNAELIKKVSLLFIFTYAFAWLLFQNDLFGFLTTILFAILLKNTKKSQLFFTVMFLIVCYIEIVGTSTLSWYWPPVLMGEYSFIPSGNPPVGVALFYFLFDFAILHLYFFLYPKVKRKYYSLKNSKI